MVKNLRLYFIIKINYLIILRFDFRSEIPAFGGGPGRNRTGTPFRAHDFKSCASTNSATGP